ncbi:hypothetical protein N7G274_005002 [Stereocaulon virgatum]|uniref:Uncharacterized protein n=1 Tax=Stereocaulon virgatum TaxID=373712 RepID=A0ABR4A9E5_9LECA
MLRLPPTLIRLDAKDLSWHIGRHNERQTQRASITSQHNAFTVSPKKHHGSRNQPQSALYSHEPVPANSRSFWDRVLADAGTPTRTQSTSQAVTTIIDPSDDFIENTHSSRASIEGDHNRDNKEGNPVFPSPFADSDTEDSRGNLTPSSSDSEVDQLRSGRSQQEKLLKVTAPASSSKRRMSFFSFHRRVRPNNLDGSSENIERRLSGGMAVDGASDPLFGRHREISQSLNGSLGAGIRDSLYGNRYDRHTVSSSLQNLHGYVDSDGGGFPNETSLPTRSTIRHVRQPSATLPPSSLRFSQAATSSSPDRYPSIPADDGGELSGAEIPGLLAYPPRRPMRYRPRSQSYSYQRSDELGNTFVPLQVDGPSTVQVTMAELPSLLVSHPPTRPAPQIPNGPGYRGFAGHASPVQAPDIYTQRSPSTSSTRHVNSVGISPRQDSGNYSSSPVQSPMHVASYGSLRSIGSAYSQPGSAHSHVSSNYLTPSPRNLSPFAAEAGPRNPRRRPSPHLPLPAPFSATPRNVSFNPALPSSSPHSPRTPHHEHLQTTPSLSARRAHRISVYDDNRDPATQPQTPAGLRRNGLPVMATQNPFNTAPARTRNLGARESRVGNWQAFATPTRRSAHRFGDAWTGFHGGQENADAVSEEERRIRRQAANEMRMGREEARRWAQRQVL